MFICLNKFLKFSGIEIELFCLGILDCYFFFVVMASSTTTVNNQPNALVNETAVQHYMRQFVDYLDNGIDFPELSQIRQLDIYLQGKKNIF